MEKKNCLYEISILFKKSRHFKPRYFWVLSSNIEKAINEVKELLKREKIAKEYKIIEVKEVSKEYNCLKTLMELICQKNTIT